MAITDDDLAVFEHKFSDWSCHSRMGNGLSLNDNQVGFRTDMQTIILKPHHICTTSGTDMEGDLHLVIAPEIITQSNKHDTFEHIGIAVRPPCITDAIGA